MTNTEIIEQERELCNNIVISIYELLHFEVGNKLPVQAGIDVDLNEIEQIKIRWNFATKDKNKENE